MAIDITAIVIEGVKAIPGAMASAAVLLPIIYRQANKIRADNEKNAAEIKAKAEQAVKEQQDAAREQAERAKEQAERAKVLLENQQRIEEKVNGNHKQAMKAIKAAGKYEGLREGKRAAVADLDHMTKVVAKATKRAARRSTDK